MAISTDLLPCPVHNHATAALSHYPYALTFSHACACQGPEGQMALMQEGFMPAMGMFLLIWTIVGNSLS